MPTDTAPSTPAATFGTPVEIPAIARELKKLWAADETRTRASLINFAIICEGEAAMQDSTELLERFVRNHSFHALLIGINPHFENEAETSLDAIENAWHSNGSMDEAPGLFEYASGTWCPKEADELLARAGHAWRRM